MVSSPSIMLPAEIILFGRHPSHITIGILAPLSGVMGVIGPSIVNHARLAAEEASNRGNGQLVDLVLIDAGRPPGEVARDVDTLVSGGLLHGLVGCHTSDVRAAVSGSVGKRVPYLFTPPREFQGPGDDSVLLGLAPDEHLLEPLRWMIEQHSARRWALLGSDYVWPHHVHRAASALLKDLGAEVVLDRFVPFGQVDTVALSEQAAGAGADAILVSIVGRDGACFHREFAQSSHATSTLRLCTSLDENGLLAISGDESGGLFAAMPGFVLGADDRHLALVEAYRARFGALAPVPGAYSEGCYDGVHLLIAMCMTGRILTTEPRLAAAGLLEAGESRDQWSSSPLGAPTRAIGVGRANGTDLEVVANFALA